MNAPPRKLRSNFPRGSYLWAVRNAQWQAMGMDKHSIVADPTFADPAAGDFTIKIPAVAESIGFKAFDVHDVGPIIEPQQKGAP
jgi:hypothetical protein